MQIPKCCEIIGSSSLAINMVDDQYKTFFRLNEILDNIETYLPNFDKKKFLKAFYFAEKGHEGQMRKDNTTPYFVHPVEVVKILMKLHADQDVLTAALLHDIPEDTKHTMKEVKALFGDKVAFLVDGATKLSKVQYQSEMHEAEVDYLKKFFLHSAKDPRVILIKLADRLHNMITLQNIKEPEKRLRIARETLEIYVPIANLLGIQEIKAQLEDLCFRYLFPTEYEQMDARLDSLEKERVKNEHEFQRAMKKILVNDHVKAEVIPRKRNLYAIYKRLSAERKTIEEIDARVGFKIVVDDVPDCYKVLGLIHGHFLPKTDKFRDYIANAKQNGYQSLHTTVFGIHGVVTNLQIRTKEMDIKDEFGVASAFFEKTGKKSAKKISLSSEEKNSWVDKILESTMPHETSDEFLESLKLDFFQDRIFVFTPLGTTVDLPKAASALDFAYTIHTEVGNHATKADINGHLKPVSTPLHTGDIVKIITDEKITPELSWLSFVKTNTAKNRIIASLKKSSKEQKLRLGHRILQKEFDILGWGLIDSLNFKKVREYLMRTTGKHYNNLEEIFLAIGEGEIKSVTVVKALSGHKSASVVPPTKGIGMSIKIVGKNRFGLLRDISDVIYKTASDIGFLKGWVSRSNDEAFFSIHIKVDSIEDARKIFNELEQVDDVNRVYRVSTKGLMVFGIFGILATLVWILHPIFIRDFINSSFAIANPLQTNLVMYVSLFGLLAILVYLNNVLKNYFPMFRNKMPVWILTFTIPVISTATLAMEIIYFKLNLSWLVILTEILVIYVYLGITYRNFKKFM